MVTSGRLIVFYKRMKLMGYLVIWLVVIHQSNSGFKKRVRITAYFYGDEMGLVWSCEEGD